jgi:hypothetical protein
LAAKLAAAAAAEAARLEEEKASKKKKKLQSKPWTSLGSEQEIAEENVQPTRDQVWRIPLLRFYLFGVLWAQMLVLMCNRGEEGVLKRNKLGLLVVV